MGEKSGSEEINVREGEERSREGQHYF